VSAAVAVDVVVLTLDDTKSGSHEGREPHEGSEGHEDRARLRFLAVRRREPPYRGRWSLPGRIVRDDENLDDAALTALTVLTALMAHTRDIDDSGVRHMEQLATFGAPDRDPRGRVVSVSYLGLLPRPLSTIGDAATGEAATGDAATGEAATGEAATGRATSGDARWLPVSDTDDLGFDHAKILDAGMARLRGKLGYSNIAYGLLPDEFTLRELQDVYEAVMGATLDKRNFRKKMLGLGLLAETENLRRGPHRPAQLYRFAQPRLVTIDAAAIA
jgi:8-oxo-dGTP diphosphatase